MVVLTVVLTAIIGVAVVAAARASYARTHALAAPLTVAHAELDVLRLAPSAAYAGEGVGADVPTASPPTALTTSPEPATTEPTPTPVATPMLAATPQATAYAAAVPGTAEAWLAAADVPPSLRPAFAAIGACESHHNPAAVGDSGNSLGWLQLWRGWFRPGEDPYDPVVNAAVGLRVYQARGRFGGAGGWTCADILGIP